MRFSSLLLIALLLSLASPTGVFAVQPDEVLADPVLEARARDISRNLRCPVCQGESIDDSNAPISRDLRLVVRERLVAGDTDEEVVDFIVARYGEFVLFNPRVQGVNLLLWLAGPGSLIVGAGIAYAYTRRRSLEPVADNGLSAEEEARVKELLDR
ncbi:cytochrome c-type biogenesis protein [Thioclava sp. FR2]|uniref:cytochrome c-type biogenesis protein n=1 Tax=Thioclava sp. FR2 TaxID=3445780 RepID=UPI003EBDC60D